MNARYISIDKFLKESQGELLLDVRAPIEFEKGHLAQAFNIPLFDNMERAEIGTLYKQQGKDTAVTRGLEIVSPKMLSLATKVKELSKNGKVYVYCFRGGMRSGSFGWLMSTVGLDTYILKGGYRSFRNYILEYFGLPRQIVLLGGKTGSGKTEILKELSKLEFQTIDLEKIAHHKGSAFGSINELAQNPQQVFEAELYHELSACKALKTTVFEDESQTIGFNKIPQGLWDRMTDSTIIHIEVPLELRVMKLVADYETADLEALRNATKKISKRLGPMNTKLCLQHIDNRNFADVARLALLHYDKSYAYSYENKKKEIVYFEADTIDECVNALKVKDIIDNIKI